MSSLGAREAARGVVGGAKFLAIVQPAGVGTQAEQLGRDGRGDVLVQWEDGAARGAPPRLHLLFVVVPIACPRISPSTALQDRGRLRLGTRHSSSSLHLCYRLPEFEPVLFFHSHRAV